MNETGAAPEKELHQKNNTANSKPLAVNPLTLSSEDPNERLQEITEKLEHGILDLFESDRFKEYLQTMSRFHNYSLRNTILILLQKPDASFIAGFNAWKKNFGRHVLKGERGIKVIAPAPYKITRAVPKIDPQTQKIVLGENGEAVTETKEITIPAFKVVSVFDISQTEGKELPTIGVDSLDGSVEQYNTFFAALEQVSPVPVSFESLDEGTHGYYHLTEKRIALKAGESELQTVKTFIHEIAHAKLHSIDLNAPKEELEHRPDRRTREVQAESVAYTVCQHFGLETSEYSFSYIAGWSSGKEITELKKSLEVIRSAANELIVEIEGHFRDLQQQRIVVPEIFTQATANDHAHKTQPTTIEAEKKSIGVTPALQTNYREQIQAIFEYEIVCSVPHDDRLTQWFPEGNVSVAKPFYKENTPEGRTGISEEMISHRFSEIFPSTTETHIHFETVQQQGNLQRVVLAQQIDSFAQLYALNKGSLPSPFSIEDSFQRIEAIKMLLISDQSKVLFACQEIIQNIDPLWNYGLNETISAAQKEYKKIEEACTSLQRYQRSRGKAHGRVSMSDLLSAAKAEADHRNAHNNANSKRRDDLCLASTS